MAVEMEQESLAARAYGSLAAEENYYCNFGMNPTYRQTLQDAGLRISGWDFGGEPRIVELPGHPFYLGTLFVPQSRSTLEDPHPIILAFIKASRTLEKCRR